MECIRQLWHSGTVGLSVDDQQVYSWAPRIKQVAKTVARDSPDSEQDDLEQSMWVALITQETNGKPLDPDSEYATSALYYVARSQALNDRRDALRLSSQYAYRTKDVRVLLEVYFDRSEWGSAVTPEDAASELGNVGLEMSSDLSRAWDRLTWSHKVLIFSAFALGEKVDSKKLSSAVSRMCDIINEYQPSKRDGLGTREILSNGQARTLLEEQ